MIDHICKDNKEVFILFFFRVFLCDHENGLCSGSILLINRAFVLGKGDGHLYGGKGRMAGWVLGLMVTDNPARAAAINLLQCIASGFEDAARL